MKFLREILQIFLTALKIVNNYCSLAETMSIKIVNDCSPAETMSMKFGLMKQILMSAKLS